MSNRNTLQRTPLSCLKYCFLSIYYHEGHEEKTKEYLSQRRKARKVLKYKIIISRKGAKRAEDKKDKTEKMRREVILTGNTHAIYRLTANVIRYILHEYD